MLRKINLQIWDTLGGAGFNNFTNIFYRQSDVVIIFFDSTNRESFDDVESWI